MPVLNSEHGDRPTPLGRLWQEHSGSVAAQQATAPERARLHWINEQIDARTQQIGHVSIRELTMQFHDALSECAHNTVLLEIVRQLHDSARRFGETTFSLPGRASVAIADESTRASHERGAV
jgi:DNA-binding FadR family transcriptional regulator